MKHLNSIDIVRSLSMLYILIFHCGNYTEEINFQPWGDFLKAEFNLQMQQNSD